jgi:hypothetical protein
MWRWCHTPFQSYRTQLRDYSDNIRFKFHFLLRETHKAVCAIRDCKKETLISIGEKNEINSRNCLPHHKRASTYFNTHKAAGLHLLALLARYYPMSDSVQCDEQYIVQKENPDFDRREQNEEIISSNCLPYHKRARNFRNAWSSPTTFAHYVFEILLNECEWAAWRAVLVTPRWRVKVQVKAASHFIKLCTSLLQ